MGEPVVNCEIWQRDSSKPRLLGQALVPDQPRPHQQWSFTFTFQERKEVEGSLFLIRRNEEPCCQIIILNKKSTREAPALLDFAGIFSCTHNLPVCSNMHSTGIVSLYA